MRTNTLHFNELTLELKSFNQQICLDRPERFSANNTRVSSYIDHALNREMVRFQHFVYCGKPQKETHEVKYPAGWWNAFKAAYPRLCKWLSPVKYVTVKVQWEGRLAFPGLEVRSGFETVQIWNGPTFEETK